LGITTFSGTAPGLLDREMKKAIRDRLKPPQDGTSRLIPPQPGETEGPHHFRRLKRPGQHIVGSEVQCLGPQELIRRAGSHDQERRAFQLRQARQ
jgi:hypothetical protein